MLRLPPDTFFDFLEQLDALDIVVSLQFEEQKNMSSKNAYCSEICTNRTHDKSSIVPATAIYVTKVNYSFVEKNSDLYGQISYNHKDVKVKKKVIYWIHLKF